MARIKAHDGSHFPELAKIRELSRLLRILRLVAKLVTERRDREAWALAAMWPQRGKSPSLPA